MKFLSLSKKREQGSVLVITLITCGVVAMVLASYLVLLASRYNLTGRSMAWNSAMPVLEAGVEEALTHLQSDTSSSPSANGWAAGYLGGQPVNTKTRNLADGSYASVTIYNAASDNPTIWSSGFVPAPFGRGYISRTVRVTTTKPKAYAKAILANGLITLSGGALVDSYSSCLGAYSTNNSLGTNSGIATNAKLNPSIKLMTGHVYGTVKSGAGGTVTDGGGAAGNKEWNDGTHSNVQAGWGSSDMNVAFPSNAPPPGPYTTMPLPTVVGSSNITYLSTGTYSATSFTSSDSAKPMFVQGNAILYLTGNVTVSGSGYIKIFPGASLTLYIGGNNPVISGGGVVNGTQQPANFTYYGLNTNTKLTVSGSGVFIGTINAPQADMTISGSGGAFGAAIVDSYTSSGGSSFHYDECLGASGNSYTITSWSEL